MKCILLQYFKKQNIRTAGHSPELGKKKIKKIKKKSDKVNTSLIQYTILLTSKIQGITQNIVLRQLAVKKKESHGFLQVEIHSNGISGFTIFSAAADIM